jgi:hypothetical protein
MKNLVNWYKNKFKPQFFFLSTVVGVLSIFYFIGYILNIFFELRIMYSVIALIIAGFYFESIIDDHALYKEIDVILDEEKETIPYVVGENRLIDRKVYDGLVKKVLSKLYRKGFEHDSLTKIVESSIFKKIDKNHE